MAERVKVSSIFIYPIKSCRGISVPQAPITTTGFKWDRQWMVVNLKGRAYTQRVEPKLASVAVELPSEAFLEGWQPTKNSYMVIKAPGMEALKICLTTPSGVAGGVSLWEWSGSALDEGDKASKWFSDYLGKLCRLVRFNTESESRAMHPNYAKGHNIMFSDCAPFHILSQGSLNALNKLLKEPVSVDRFRPNILVEGCEPFSEDLWTEIRIGKFSFLCVMLCDHKCKIPNVDQETGIPGNEPNKTLKTFRSDKVLRPNGKQQNKIFFGHNLVWKDYYESGYEKILKVKDPVLVLQKVSTINEAPA